MDRHDINPTADSDILSRNIAEQLYLNISLPVIGYSTTAGVFYENLAFKHISKGQSAIKTEKKAFAEIIANPESLLTLYSNTSLAVQRVSVILSFPAQECVFVQLADKEAGEAVNFSSSPFKQTPYAELLGSMREVLFFSDAHGTLRFLSPAWETLTGYSLKESIGKSYFPFIDPRSKKLAQQLILPLSTTELPFLKEELLLKKKNGDSVWVEISAAIRKNPDGSNQGSYGVLYNIHDRKISEQNLFDSEARYRLISENMSDLVLVINDTVQVKFMSASAHRFFGTTDADFGNFNLVSRLYHGDIGSFRAFLSKVTKQERAQQDSFRFANAYDEFVWLACSASNYRESDTSQGAILISCRDISFQKQAEEEMLNNLEKERELNRLKSDFINMASHEFRTPLTAMKSSIDLLDNYVENVPTPDLNMRMKKHTQRIKGQIGRLTTLISDILMLGKMETGSVHYRPELTDIVNVIKGVIKESYSQRPDGRTVALKVKGKPRGLLCDPLVMSHLVGNLLSNAFKYSEGCPNPEVKLLFFEEKIEIFVTDFGMGIHESDQALLFNSFFRGQNVLNIPGTGLGLIIIKQFVELHKGKISFNSKIGEGTTFIVSLPYE